VAFDKQLKAAQQHIDKQASKCMSVKMHAMAPQVWKARCKPFDEVVAVKLMDLEAVNCSLVRRGWHRGMPTRSPSRPGHMHAGVPTFAVVLPHPLHVCAG
jgi:hypothetical protein